jgi:hypothetical protein
MGLDMYLRKKTLIREEDRKSLKIDGLKTPINPERISHITEKVGYWRKANAIHHWFVENVQEGEDDCGEYYVSFENLKKLYEIVSQVLDNPTKGMELLPTRSGFFFGSIEYGDDYVEDLKRTKTILESILQEDPEGTGYYYYQSSW